MSTQLSRAKLLVLAPLPNTAASTRFRLSQYFPLLQKAGIDPCLRPFLDEDGSRVLYRPGSSATKVAAALAAVVGRVSDLARAARADAVLVHREAALVGPPLLEWALSSLLDRSVIFDLDDAVWVPYASPTYGAMLSRLLKFPHKTNFTLRRAACVIAGNEYIAAHARSYNEHVHIVPTVVDTDVFRPAPRKNAVPVLGWIGTHSTAPYLGDLIPALRRLAKQRQFKVRVVGGTIDAPDLPIEHVAWTLASEVSEFQSADIGLYPLRHDDWSLGKSGFKAVQYMACGVPVVASPVGVTTEMVVHGHSGFLASSEDEWVGRLTELLDDAELRARLGDAGRAEAVARWSLAAHGPRFVSLVQDALRPIRSLPHEGVIT